MLWGSRKSSCMVSVRGRLTADTVPSLLRFMNMFLSTWVLLVAGLIFALPMLHMRVDDHTDDDDL